MRIDDRNSGAKSSCDPEPAPIRHPPSERPRYRRDQGVVDTWPWSPRRLVSPLPHCRQARPDGRPAGPPPAPGSRCRKPWMPKAPGRASVEDRAVDEGHAAAERGRPHPGRGGRRGRGLERARQRGAADERRQHGQAQGLQEQASIVHRSLHGWHSKTAPVLGTAALARGGATSKSRAHTVASYCPWGGLEHVSALRSSGKVRRVLAGHQRAWGSMILISLPRLFWSKANGWFSSSQPNISASLPAAPVIADACRKAGRRAPGDHAFRFQPRLDAAQGQRSLSPAWHQFVSSERSDLQWPDRRHVRDCRWHTCTAWTRARLTAYRGAGLPACGMMTQFVGRRLLGKGPTAAATASEVPTEPRGPESAGIA